MGKPLLQYENSARTVLELGINTIFLRVDKKRPYDHTINIENSSDPNSMWTGLNMMIEKGSIITFDDEGMNPSDGVRSVRNNRILSIDGIPILEMFPGRENFFPYAQKARQHRE